MCMLSLFLLGSYLIEAGLFSGSDELLLSDTDNIAALVVSGEVLAVDELEYSVDIDVSVEVEIRI